MKVFISQLFFLSALWTILFGCNSRVTHISKPDSTIEDNSRFQDLDRTKELLRSLRMPKEVGRPYSYPIAAIYFAPAIQLYRPGDEGIDYNKMFTPKLDDLIMVIWPDGHILWSDDQIRGGLPYSVGQIRKEEVDQFLKKLSCSKAFEPSLFGKSVFAYFDAGRTRMIATDGTDAMELTSMHEFYEDKSDYQYTQEGRVWTVVKQSMFDLTKKATAVKRIGNRSRAKTGLGENGSNVLGCCCAGPTTCDNCVGPATYNNPPDEEANPTNRAEKCE